MARIKFMCLRFFLIGRKDDSHCVRSVGVTHTNRNMLSWENAVKNAAVDPFLVLVIVREFVNCHCYKQNGSCLLLPTLSPPMSIRCFHTFDCSLQVHMQSFSYIVYDRMLSF